MDGAVEGMKAMLPANIILVLAWTISGVCRDLLQTPIFVQSLVADGGVSGAFLPAIVFLIAGFLSFSTGATRQILIELPLEINSTLPCFFFKSAIYDSVSGDRCEREATTIR